MNTLDFKVIHTRLPKMILAAIFTMTSTSIYAADGATFPELPAMSAFEEWAKKLTEIPAKSASEEWPKLPEVLAMSVSELDEMSASELDELRGMHSSTNINVSGTQVLDATVTGSSFNAGAINGGSVTFAEHSLDNFSGIGLFNIVTGNNNAVDSAVGVTFNLQ